MNWSTVSSSATARAESWGASVIRDLCRRDNRLGNRRGRGIAGPGGALCPRGGKLMSHVEALILAIGMILLGIAAANAAMPV